MNKNILNEKINEAEKICIIGHKNPDGDCIGSVLAIYNYIIKNFKDKKIVKAYLQEFSKKYLILPNAYKISHDTNDAEIYDLAIVLDCSNADRFNDYNRYFFEAKEKIVFDHHENNSIDCINKIVNEKASATCEIVFDYLNEDLIDNDISTCLYIGIATDTGIFRYKSTSIKTFEIVIKLLKYKFDFSHLLDVIIFENTLLQRKAQGIVFDRLKLIANGQVSFSYLLDEDLDALYLTKNDIDNVIVYLREITGVKIAGFAYQIGNKIYKLSLRSNYDIYNVAEFASMHDGGGHDRAAGCLYYGNINDVETNFSKDILEFIENNDNLL